MCFLRKWKPVNITCVTRTSRRYRNRRLSLFLSPATAVPGLTVCRFVCVMPVFISINADLSSIKKQIANRLTALSKPVAGGAEKDSRRCLKCPRLTLTKSQLYIIDAIKTGMNNQQIAQELGISHKTVFSHKINIMKKFQIDTKQELARFSAIALALSSIATH